MDIKVMASTKYDHQASGEDLQYIAGKAAGTCYMSSMEFETLTNEPVEKSIKRANSTRARGHHSVFAHGYITLQMERVPKLFAMLLNNEKVYTTSEKSARYTKMELEGVEKYLYEKWLNKFIELITIKYGDKSYFSEDRIRRLAMENARYFTSVMTPASMEYTVSYRQLNYLCGWMQQFENSNNQIYKMLAPTANEFIQKMEDFGYLDKDLMNDGKNREFSLIGKRVRQEQFGECYSVNYMGSFAMLAQAQRHRTLHYEMMLDKNPEYFIPLILMDNDFLVEEWLSDMEKVEHLVPQGQLVMINERGDYENLILKAKERLCTAAQIEVMRNTQFTIQRMIQNTDNEYVRRDLEKINTGARCTSGYKCATPCAFKEGIDLTRLI